VLAAPATADAAFAVERDDAVWIAEDDGSNPRRLAPGREPHVAPGGATVVYRAGDGVYAVPAAGGAPKLLHTIRRDRFAYVPLRVEFSADGRRALIGIAERPTLLVDLPTNAKHRLPIGNRAGALAPAGDAVAWIDQACRLVVLDVASGARRTLPHGRCDAQAAWGPDGIALAWEDRRGTHVDVVDPIAGRTRRLLSTRRVLALAGASSSGVWRLTALEDERHPAEALLVRRDRPRLTRPVGTALGDPVFTADDKAVLVVRPSGAVIRIELATGVRRRVGSSDRGVTAG
jgi:hypothetical protein